MFILPAFKIGVWNSWIFMSVFVLQMIVMMLVNKHVMERSHVPAEARKNKLEKNTGIIGNFIWLIALSYSVFLPLQFDTLWFYIGLSVFIFGFTFLVIATFNFITTPVDRLITKGVYRFSRHPMYLATFSFALVRVLHLYHGYLYY